MSPSFHVRGSLLLVGSCSNGIPLVKGRTVCSRGSLCEGVVAFLSNPFLSNRDFLKRTMERMKQLQQPPTPLFSSDIRRRILRRPSANPSNSEDKQAYAHPGDAFFPVGKEPPERKETQVKNSNAVQKSIKMLSALDTKISPQPQEKAAMTTYNQLP